MKILIISQYFWPENFRINDIALGLKELGNEVSVLTGLPNYPHGKFYEGYSASANDENWEGITIYRSKLLARGKGGGVKLFMNYLSFALFGSLKVFSLPSDFDRILVFQPSPITVGLPALVAKKKFGIPYYFWVQDLWPASLTAAGGIRNKWILKFFDQVTRKIYKEAEKILIQSKSFEQYIVNQGIDRRKIVYLPNTTERFYTAKSSGKYSSYRSTAFTLLFAGNMGEAQNLGTLVEAIKVVKDAGLVINCLMIGDGRYRSILEDKVKELGLEEYFTFIGNYPATEMPDFFAIADALYVSLKDEYIFSLTIPSKLQSYLACGRPILASLNGEPARIIKEANAGWVSPAEDQTYLAQNIIEMLNTSELERENLGKNGLDYFEREFKRSIVLQRLHTILMD